MKVIFKKIVFSCFIVLVFFLFFSACATLRQQNEASNLPDFDPVPLENTRARQQTASGLKPLDLTAYFLNAPDIVEVHFTIDRRSSFMVLDNENRQKIFTAAEHFFALKKQPVSEIENGAEKTFFSTMVPQTQNNLSAGYTVIDNTLYFFISNENSLFFTEAQLELFLAAIDPDVLRAISDSLQIDNFN